MKPGVLLISVWLLALGAATEWTVVAQGKKTVWDGVYTDAQADRGVAVYSKECTVCHADTLRGNVDGGPPLTGAEFETRWNGVTIADMVKEVAEMMPADEPNSLTQQQYVDVIAFLLRANKRPSGASELPVDADKLAQVEFTMK